MRIAERTSDFEFLTDGEGLLGTDNLEFADSSTLTTLHGLQVEDGTKVHLQFVSDKLLEFLLSERYLPAIEIGSLLVIVIQYLRKNLLVCRIAESRWVRANPLLSLFLAGKIRHNLCILDTQGYIPYGCEIILRRILPAILELFGNTATTLRESGITNLITIQQNLSSGESYRLCHMW